MPINQRSSIGTLTGNRDGQFFEDGRFIVSDWGFLVPLLGFAPAATLSLIAKCSSQVDHGATALLTAEIMDITGGVAFVELHDHQVEPVRAPCRASSLRWRHRWTSRPSLSAMVNSLRAFAATAGFRLFK